MRPAWQQCQRDGQRRHATDINNNTAYRLHWVGDSRRTASLTTTSSSCCCCCCWRMWAGQTAGFNVSASMCVNTFDAWSSVQLVKAASLVDAASQVVTWEVIHAEHSTSYLIYTKVKQHRFRRAWLLQITTDVVWANLILSWC